MEKLQVIKHPKFGQLSVIIVNGKEMFKANECAAMLGYSNINDAISRHCKGVVKHDLLTKGGKQKVSLIPEGDVWRLIIRSKLPQAMEIEKWIMDEVLPTIRKTGTYTMKHEPKPTKPYEYFDKTYNGVPVLTALDVEKLTGVSATMVDYYMKHKAKHGKDYYQLTNTNLRNFKLENPKIVKFIKRLNIITREGFIKFCRAYGVQIDTPKCFEVKEEPKKPQIDYNKFERAFSLGASSGKLVKNIKNDIITIQMICDFMGCGFHVYSDYDAYRKTLYEAVKKLYTYANDLRQIKLEC
ncbi:MAG: BRO family protein [Candidatus Pseudoruminococcus sp.]|nr:hypothetical protein [Ruminococcus sp.]MDY2782401.1 BRO family protein [Candidatus Pseudoruminococcus sp.]